MSAFDGLVREISDRFVEALDTANHSTGANDDRAVVMAIESLTGAVLAVAMAIEAHGANPQGGDGS